MPKAARDIYQEFGNFILSKSASPVCSTTFLFVLDAGHLALGAAADAIAKLVGGFVDSLRETRIPVDTFVQ